MFALQQHLVSLQERCYLLAIILLIFGIIFGSRSCYGQKFVVVEIVTPSNNEKPDDSDLTMRILRDLDAGHTLIFANMGIGRNIPSNNKDNEKAIALIKIEAPDKITSTRTLMFGGRTATRLAPVRDSKAFCDSIDYATILERSPDKRFVKLRINSDELEDDKLRPAPENQVELVSGIKI